MRIDTEEKLTRGCPCEGKTLERFIRPAVLMILAQGEEYGYRVLQRLSEMPSFDGQKPNTAGIYRCLKLMAEEGLVEPSWALPEAGPAKRLYRLTPDGEHCLASWMLTLAGYRRTIDGLLEYGNAIIARWRDEQAKASGA